MGSDPLKTLAESIGKMVISEATIPGSLFHDSYFPEVQPLETIDFEDTIPGEIKKIIEEQKSLEAQQLTVLYEQNTILADNYAKIKELYDAQSESYKAAKEDLIRSRKYNVVMMVIAIIAMLAAIASPIVTILVSIK